MSKSRGSTGDRAGRKGRRSVGRRNGVPKRRQFTEDEKEEALQLAASGVARSEIAKAIGCSCESVRLWVRAAEQDGSMPGASAEPDAPIEAKAKESDATESGAGTCSIYTPRDPGQGLGEHEEGAILEIKRKHPSMGPAQIRAQLKRFRGWRVATKAIARVLRAHGHELVHRGSRPWGPEPIRFEAPRRNAIWQTDYAELRVGGERMTLLVILDDFSRFVVGHGVGESATTKLARCTLMAAIARHGKPEAVRTDRGGGFMAKSKETDFARTLEIELIDHIVGHSYHPQGGGKVESLIGTVRRELWEVEEFSDRAEAERRLAAFFEDYNESRAHMGIGGLTPADRYFGRADRVLAAIDAVSRQRQGAMALMQGCGEAVEERLSSATGAPLEVLRLVRVNGRLELHFCGSRVVLGAIQA